jgi:hypothetical protein
MNESSLEGAHWFCFVIFLTIFCQILSLLCTYDLRLGIFSG